MDSMQLIPTGLAPHIELRICCSCEMHSFSFAFEDLSTGGAEAGPAWPLAGAGPAWPRAWAEVAAAWGLATGLGRGFFWMFFGSIFGLGAALAGVHFVGVGRSLR